MAPGIASVLVVLVVQKRREMGILRAIDAGRRRIMVVFLLRGGLVGSLFGSAMAVGLLEVFSRIFKSPDDSPLFPSQLDPMLVLLPSVVACGVGLAAAR